MKRTLPRVNEPASPEPQSAPGQADQVFVTSINENRSVYVINKNNQAIDVLVHCESPGGWQNNYAMVAPDSHKLLCDDVVNESVYFWARSEDGACTWDGKDTETAKPLVHPVDEVEYETLMYDIALQSKIRWHTRIGMQFLNTYPGTGSGHRDSLSPD